jgi:metallo-beta-lactamase family protein
MTIQFCGAAGTVTGSCHLLTLDDGYKILLDCGLYQGSEDEMISFNREWFFEPASIGTLVLSHAHIDHSGRIPKLTKDGFEGTVYCTPATRDLCSIMLMDSAQIQVKDAEYENRHAERRNGKGKKDEHASEPLYTQEDAAAALALFASFPYEKWFPIHPDVDVLFRDAGHILGSASVTLRIRRGGMKDTFLGFTGDIGRPDRPILRDPKPMLPCDYLICESTYGDRLHEFTPDQDEKLLSIIRETCVEKKGKLIIPAFSVGRTQELVFTIDRLENEGRLPRDVSIYVDSPMAVNATDVFRLHPECFNEELRKYLLSDPDPFGFSRLHYVKEVEDSKKLNEVKSAIIISASGMITAGRIRHHIFNSIENPDNTVLMVGYCAPHTLGARLAAGKDTIRMFGQELMVRARVESLSSFSAHGDQQEMIDFLRTQEPKRLRKLFLVHGEEDRQLVFKQELERNGYQDVILTILGESVEL